MIALQTNAAGLVRGRPFPFGPQASVAKTAFDALILPKTDAVTNLDRLDRRQVVGLLTEAHALRRYSETLELRRRELLGDA